MLTLIYSHPDARGVRVWRISPAGWVRYMRSNKSPLCRV